MIFIVVYCLFIIIYVDKIVVIENGYIVEIGMYCELIVK